MAQQITYGASGGLPDKTYQGNDNYLSASEIADGYATGLANIWGERDRDGFLGRMGDNEPLFRREILSSSWMMQAISHIPVLYDLGQAFTMGSNTLCSGRKDGGRFIKRVPFRGTEYRLADTETCASVTYQDLTSLLNFAGTEFFVKTLQGLFHSSISLDILRTGFNGTHVAVNTDPEKYPMGEDINKGWHEIARKYNGGSQIITDNFTLGSGGDFSNVDELAQYVINEKIPQPLRERPDLVVLVGYELAAHDRARLFSDADKKVTLSGMERMQSQVAGRFAFIPPFMPGKRLTVTTLANLQVMTGIGTQRLKVGWNDDTRTFDHYYIRAEAYALGDPLMYAATDESAVTFTKAGGADKQPEANTHPVAVADTPEAAESAEAEKTTD
ncbi:P2 family phage major capsid protein [Salmonella enterica]|uniref:Major capsid protein n=1 Tax=Salmonella enterica TaxID=28901 RepID=A0A5T2WTF7_SALER|nr:P2 family phage major capsid protein [Salmonella enterica]ECL9777918.1 P2 family phage major capsid protein [Salmonella enterica subsp. enterica serovar Rubislaw]EAM8466449.1 major capsid protein [Salmonella enterica]EAM8631134.1 major capsid protein [Salmonella enterica]EAO1959800.1 major capsid protein [Salmonella enterica]EAX2321569.1 P2 family phage major capsid protein [Salmonella enterica]